MEKISGIYSITNVVNGKIYIGSSVDIHRRWDTHKSKLESKNHQNPHLISAWHKYGKEKFLFEIIELVEQNEIIEREQFWLDELKPYDRNIGYNCANVAGASFLGKNHTEESKAKIAEYHRNRARKPLTEEHKEILRTNNLGKTFGEDFRKKVSEARTGMKFSEEHKENIQCSKKGNSFRKGKKLNAEQRSKISGENSWNSKLKEEDVVKIKKMLKEEKHPKEIAPIFNVSVSCIKKIKSERSWKHVGVC